ncbi:MAG: helix-turn-helix domain-containing protein [Ktedonobacteraceae bacterium]|nr:helix-turn-helix domain-containing protein [Ktedonobacteraceae bacterium]MBO0795903.1 helix-turn-helix domain-containing protein [Ktedonobacteraceae bacterium]
MTDGERRQELADFLRTRRARLVPAEVGLPLTARRKTVGLRREEVAQLASVGVTWYTWLEQGRDIHVSAQVLDSLAQALRLSADEKAHLFLLAGQVPLPHPSAVQEQISPFLQKFLEHLGTTPAYITGRRWDLLAWNRGACEIFGDFAAMSPDACNILHFIFTNSELRRRLLDWEGIAQRALAQFRASSSRYRDDAQFAALIKDLQQVSPEFARWWPRHDVRGRQDGRKELVHPQVGYLAFDHSTFQVNDPPDLRVTVYLPASEETASKLEHLLVQENIGV